MRATRCQLDQLIRGHVHHSREIYTNLLYHGSGHVKLCKSILFAFSPPTMTPRRVFTWKVKRFPRIIDAKINAPRCLMFESNLEIGTSRPTCLSPPACDPHVERKDNARSHGETLVILNIKRDRPIRGFTIQVFASYASVTLNAST